MYDKLKKRLSEIVVEDEQKDVDQLEKVDDELTDLPEGEKAEDKKELPEEDCKVKKEDCEEDPEGEPEETKEPVDPEGEELEESAKVLKNVLDKDKLDKFAKRVAKKVNGREVQSIKIRKASRSEYMKKKATTLVGKALLFGAGANLIANADYVITKDYKSAKNTQKLLHGAVAAGTAATVAVESDKFFLLEVVMKDVEKPLTFLIGDGKNEESVKKEGANIISEVKKAISEYTVKEDSWLIDETVDSTEDEYFTEAQIVEFIPDGIFSIAEAETLEEAAKVDDKKIEKFAKKVAKKVNGREVS